MAPHLQSVWKLSGVPVLMYHGIRSQANEEEPRDKYCLDEDRFVSQLDRCSRAALPLVSLKHNWRNSQDGANAVVATFDDGSASDFEVAFPRLLERGYRADFFVNSSTVGKFGYVSWEQLKEMDRAGMSIQSHGSEHVPLTLLRGQALREQLLSGRTEIEDRLGSEVKFLSVPFGFMNSRVLDAALEVGFNAVCDSVSWPARMGNQVIHRIAIERSTSEKDFESFLFRSAMPFIGRNLRRTMLHIPKQILLRLAPGVLGLPTEVHP
jgi:peptidoglycan/xylan/chitin deacetylase (PgdA/CDA1 family)